MRYPSCVLVVVLAAGLLSGQTARRITRTDAVQEKAEFVRHPKVALVVVVGEYPQGSGLSRLRYAAKDAVQVAAALEQHGFLVRTLTNTEALRGSLRRSLQELAQAVNPDEGSRLFYFSGHGFAYDGVNYLATYGTTAADLKSEGLPLPEVEKILKQSGAKRQIMFIDACRNEPGAGGKSVANPSFVADRRQRLHARTASATTRFRSPTFRSSLWTTFGARREEGPDADFASQGLWLLPETGIAGGAV